MQYVLHTTALKRFIQTLKAIPIAINVEPFCLQTCITVVMPVPIYNIFLVRNTWCRLYIIYDWLKAHTLAVMDTYTQVSLIVNVLGAL